MNHSLNLERQVLTIIDLSFNEVANETGLLGGLMSARGDGGNTGSSPGLPLCPGSREPHASRSFSFQGVVRMTEVVAGHEEGGSKNRPPTCVDYRFYDDESYAERQKPWWNPF
jgi:hypothetical protein